MEPKPALKASKCFEGEGPLVIWAVSLPGHPKCYLIADARQQSFGVRLTAERTEGIKLGGAVVNVLRKHARTAGITEVARDRATGDYWLALHVRRDGPPNFWLHLAKGSPPELRFLDSSGTVLIRRSSQGTYTKRRQEALPPFPLVGMDDLLPELVASFDPKPNRPDPVPELRTITPEYQRDAKDRLSRRLKTLRKALERLRSQGAARGSADVLRRKADVLAAHLYEIAPGSTAFTGADDAGPVDIALDPALTAGQNLAEYYAELKKAKRGTAVLTGRIADGEAELAALTSDVATLRREILPEAEVARLLRRYRVAATKQAPRADQARAKSLPYRIFYWPTAGGGKVSILVGKGGADNDALCKAAKGNDYWLHGVATTGSHVVIPAREVGPLPPPAALVRAGAILALHFSKLRADLKGEVYFTRRHSIKKRKGMAPGLWQVEAAETLFIRYDDQELMSILALAREAADEGT